MNPVIKIEILDDAPFPSVWKLKVVDPNHLMWPEQPVYRVSNDWLDRMCDMFANGRDYELTLVPETGKATLRFDVTLMDFLLEFDAYVRRRERERNN